MKTLLLLAAVTLISGCAATTQETTQVTRRPQIAQHQVEAADPEPEETRHQTPHEFHTTYYDKEGSTHDVITEVDAEGNQEVIRDNILVIGSGREE